MTILVIDLSSIAHQIPISASRLSTSKGVPTGHVYSFLRKIPKIKELDPDLIIFCLDAGHEDRDKIDSSYKANRNKMATSTLIEDLIPLIKGLPVVYCVKQGCEADDLLFTLAYFLKEKEEVVLFSKDYDISYSLIFYPKVRHLFTFDHEITPTSLFIHFGCTPDQLPLFKAIFGDSSDNIKGIKLGRDKHKVLNSFCDEANTYKDIISIIPKDHWPTILKNLKLVRPKIISGIEFNVGESNMTTVNRYLLKFEIRSIQAREILKNFPTNKELIKTTVKILSNA